MKASVHEYQLVMNGQELQEIEQALEIVLKGYIDSYWVEHQQEFKTGTVPFAQVYVDIVNTLSRPEKVQQLIAYADNAFAVYNEALLQPEEVEAEQVEVTVVEETNGESN